MGYPFNGRKRQRLDGYDYRQANTYFVTFRTFDSASLFGEVTEKGIAPSKAGQMVDAHIRALPGTYADVRVLEWVVMPDHVHILLTILPGDSPNAERPSLPAILGRLKSTTANAYIRGVKESGWPPFDRKVWQVSYHDRIVRDEDELNAIRRYIQRNPERRWLRLCAERNSNAR